MNRVRALAAILGIALAHSVWADPVHLPDTARLISERISDARRYALPIAPFAETGLEVEMIEGRVEQRSWRIDNPALTTLQALAPMRAGLEEAGYEIRLDCDADTCGGFDFRFAIDVIPAPDMYVDLRDYQALSARRAGEARFLLVSRGASAIWVQDTLATEVAGTVVDRIEPSDTAGADLDDSWTPRNSFAEQLANLGFAVLDDLEFQSGSTSLGTGPYATLAAVAEMLEGDPTLRIALVGHTDTTGGLDLNLSLSERRANAVRDRLISDYGIDASRIEARGLGYLAPRSSVYTETGRAGNRRVEVVILPAT